RPGARGKNGQQPTGQWPSHTAHSMGARCRERHRSPAENPQTPWRIRHVETRLGLFYPAPEASPGVLAGPVPQKGSLRQSCGRMPRVREGPTSYPPTKTQSSYQSPDTALHPCHPAANEVRDIRRWEKMTLHGPLAELASPSGGSIDVNVDRVRASRPGALAQHWRWPND